MGRFTITSKDGDLPRGYVVRNLYSCPPYDPYSGRICERKVGLANKDVADYKSTVKVKGGKKSGRLEVTDLDENRPMGRALVRRVAFSHGPAGEDIIRYWEEQQPSFPCLRASAIEWIPKHTTDTCADITGNAEYGTLPKNKEGDQPSWKQPAQMADGFARWIFDGIPPLTLSKVAISAWLFQI